MARQRLLAVVVLALLGWTNAQAGPLKLFHNPDCPRPSYSPLHYWAPTLVRLHATVHRTGLPHPEDRYPGVPITHEIVPYHCPAIPPEANYWNTNLPYDPNGVFSLPPLVQAADPQPK